MMTELEDMRSKVDRDEILSDTINKGMYNHKIKGWVAVALRHVDCPRRRERKRWWKEAVRRHSHVPEASSLQHWDLKFGDAEKDVDNL